MSEQKRGMNKRIQMLREQSESTPPSISLERALLVTEVYQKYEDTVSVPMLRALVFKHLMEHKSICISDGELIVGERGTAPQVTPTYPELCCHTLDDLTVINERKKISFTVSEAVRKIQQEKGSPSAQLL